MALIETGRDLERGALRLVALEPRFGAALRTLGGGPLPLRRDAGGFAALAGAIVSQQVSLASARAISDRLAAAGLVDAGAVRAASAAALAACGLSRPKIRYLQALAGADLDYGALHRLPDEEVCRRLMDIPGIGRWSAELYLLQSLGRADVLPAGDLALREATRRLFDLPMRPSEPDLRAMAAAWAPVRAVAARLLWAYYARVKQREGNP